MNSYIEWYWDWGNFTWSALIFLLGVWIGWTKRGEKE